MRRDITLFISDRKVDLNDQSFILFNYTMEDLSNPTIVKNSFSKQITIPGTANNNSIFGDYFRLDRVTQYGAGYTGVEFDAMRQTPFSIYDERSELVESGYVKLDKVTRKGSMVEYSISLYGGLGSFFYGLSMKEDGTQMTLADMQFLSLAGDYDYAGVFPTSGYEAVYDAWSWLQSPTSYNPNLRWKWSDVLSFAPCYNGLVSNFDSNKILISNNEPQWNNVYRQVVSEGGQYAKHPDASSVLVTMTNKHTEWEMRDLRWYLQRPVIRLKAIIDAICYPANNGGYTVELDEIFFSSSNPYYESTWLTLPMIPIEKRTELDVLANLLKSTKSPAAYLISLAKTFGLIFSCDPQTKKVAIRRRSSFYNDKTIDLTSRIDLSSIVITPVLATSRYYQFGNDAIGEWAKTYKEEHGRAYGCQIVNTGNEFDRETKVVTSDIIFKNAADVQERSLLFTTDIYRFNTETSSWDIYMTLPAYEEVKSQLWLNGQSKEFAAYAASDNVQDFIGAINPSYPLDDLFPKVQLHDADNKEIDGADVLLMFDDFYSLPYYEDIRSTIFYKMTDDTEDMNLLNGGVPCYNLSGMNSTNYNSIPCFRRNVFIGDQGYSLDFGQPLEVAYPIVGSPATVYEIYWQDYQTDRYDDDTYAMVCKVNLQGFQVGQELMRNFFYYDGALFVLNKIINHSLSTWDDTECEFIRVQDKNNY